MSFLKFVDVCIFLNHKIYYTLIYKISLRALSELRPLLTFA